MIKGKRILAMMLTICLCVSLFGVVPVQAADGEPGGGAGGGELPIYQDTSYSFDERAADLVARLSLTEKASQMNSSISPAIPRLGIAQYGWWNEALHGVSKIQYLNNANATTTVNNTSYPLNLSLGSSWDADLMYNQAVKISDEARDVVPNNNLNLSFYSPTINLARDPRWGRNDEAFSEDPLLTAKIAAQFVNGMEGKDKNGKLLSGYIKTITTLKHYAANNSEFNRLSGTSNMDDRTLREYYTKAFKDIVKSTDVRSVMSSYNSVNGIPSAANVYLNQHLMRATYGFTGYFTSDCDSVFTMGSQRQKWIPAILGHVVDQYERTAFALAAGEDLNCMTGYKDSYGYGNTVTTALSKNIETTEGIFNENDVDVSLQRLFAARMQTGEFDPDVANQKWVKEAKARLNGVTWVNNDTNLAVTETADRLELARVSAANSLIMLKNDVTDVGGGVQGTLLPLKPNMPYNGSYNVAVIGYFAQPTNTSGGDNTFYGGYSATQASYGTKNTVTPFAGIKKAIQDYNPGAEVTFYKGFTSGTTAATLTTVDAAAITAAAAADLCIVYVGEDASTSAEDKDRTTISLPGAQQSLISQVSAANSKTVVVMETFGNNDITAFASNPNVPAILWSSFNGQRKGEGLADVLMGDINPSGHLPFTWHRSASDIPNIANYDIRPKDTTPGRTYMYYSGPVTYPFGYGLSYTTFGYSNLQIDKKTLAPDDTFNVSVDVKNTGTLSGSEVVQLYINTPDAAASLERPIKRLKGFQKIQLNPGQTKTVTIPVNVSDLAFFDEAQGKYVVDNGRYGIQIGETSADADIKVQDYVTVTGTLTPKLDVVSVMPSQEGDDTLDYQQRLIFQRGKKVMPRVTVSMNDETLYGYISKGESKPMPAGMAVTYTSNRPSVASVDGSGNITTGNAGAATITATVSYNSISKSRDFVVYVEARGYIDGMTVDGQPVSGFAKEKFDYTLELPDGTTAIPQIAPISSDPGVTITVNQATSLPGVATIVTQQGAFSQTYRVGFAMKPKAADFTSGILGSEWSIMNPDTTKYTIDLSGLKITSQAGDITDDSVKNLFLQPAGGDWTAQTKITLSAAPTANYQQVGILAYGDKNNYIKLDYERNGSNTYFRFFNATAGTLTTQVGTATLAGQTTVYFRLIKQGTTYRGYYSTNGTTFTQLGTATTAELFYPRIGLMSFNGAGSTAASINATFEYLKIYSAAAALPTASTITVGGQPLPGFSPSVTTYSIALPRTQTTVPEVVATVADPSMNVSVTKATSLPGVTSVTVSSELGSITYNITLGYAPTSTSFLNGTMDADWTVLNPDPAGYSLVPGAGLRLPTQPVEFSNTTRNWTNVFVRPAAGDWDVVSAVYYPAVPSANYQQQALLVWQDEDNYIKMDCENNGTSGTSIKFQLSKEANAAWASVTSATYNVTAGAPLNLYYRIKKIGNTYTSSYSVDGTNYINLGSTTAELKNTQIGLFATKSSTTSPTIDTYCRYIEVMAMPSSDATLSDLRVDGVKVTGFTPSVTDYTVYLPVGTTTVPTVTAAVYDTGKATASITPATSIPGITTVVVTAQDGTTKKTYKVIFKNTPKQFAIETNGVLGRTGGLQASVKVTPTEGIPTHSGKEVVLFQLMRGTTPVNIIALSRDITSQEEFIAYFNVNPSDTSYEVRAYVLDSFNSDLTSVPASLAEGVTLH